MTDLNQHIIENFEEKSLYKDEVLYFCYRNEHIDYLEKLFNRKIKYKYGLISKAILLTVDTNNFTIFYGNGIYDNSVDGIVVKLKQDEFLILKEMNNQDLMLSASVFVYINTNKSQYINCYYLCSLNYSENIPSLEIVENRYKILQNCKNIHNLYQIKDIHFYSLHKYLISWNNKNNFFIH